MIDARTVSDAVAGRTGLPAQGDPRLLGQVLDNLPGNGWEFSAGRACTRIAFGRQAGRAGEPVYFVRDSGAGFDLAQKLFAAFQRLHREK
ncbi:hypothetical protein [Polaromonas sp.]|uniref:hypothetical protein n=1 Tax=Polaromonas sp. TaxID=1869339 RepID=UPI0025EB2925|nr:hypothetical protein [Polaromonas sp.]